MKKNLLFFIITFVSILHADLSYNSKLLNVNHYTTIESSLDYQYKITNNLIFQHSSFYNLNKNDFFDRSNKTSQYNWQLNHRNRWLNYSLIYNYQHNINKGLPEDSVSLINKRNQQLGVLINKKIPGNITLTEYVGLNKLNNSNYQYSGLLNKTDINHIIPGEFYQISTNFHYSSTDTYMDKFETKYLTISSKYKNTCDFLNTLSVYDTRQNIYEYYQYTDTQKRNDYTLKTTFSVPFLESFRWNINQNSSFRKNNYALLDYKNNWTFDHNLESSLTSYLSTSKNNFGVKTNLKKRYLKDINQYRETIDKTIFNTYTSEGFLIDTLTVDANLQLMQNFHSDTYKFMDNDRLNHFVSLMAYNIMTPAVHLKNFFSYHQSHQVYISRSLSANNNLKKTYFFKPEGKVFFNDKFNFYNNYSITATYEDYKYDEYRNDRFYRKLNGEWGFAFRSSSDNVNRFICSFIYETNETAEDQNNSWKLNSHSIIRYYVIKYTGQYKTVRISLEPQLKYLYQTFETEMLADMVINLNRQSYLKCTINPMGNRFNALIWKAGLELSLTY